MDQSDSEPNNTWEWIPCTYDVKRITKETETTWNLSPSISLMIPSENGNFEPQINLKLEQSRQFMYAEEVGWNWHKSWNLPDIGVELEIIDPQTHERLAPPNKIYCKLQIVKTAVSPMQTFHLLEVGVKGNQKVDLENGKCIFSGLKFNTTSYNHDHQKFHIVITLYLWQSKFEFPQILESRISPPIFVDSRKSARDITQQKKQKIQSYFDPFSPDIIEKNFVKRDSKFKFTNEEEINNSVDGLINYFSAPNIRHKVKHPLFLAFKFHICIQLHVNTQFIKNQDNKSLIRNIQEVLQKSQSGTKPLEQKSLIIAVDSSNSLNQSTAKQKKIMEFLEPFNNDSIEVIIDPVGLPKSFFKLENVAELQQAYSEVFDTLETFKKDEQELEFRKDKKKKKEQKEEEINPEKIRKIIQIQGPNINPQKVASQHVIEQAEILMSAQMRENNNEVKVEVQPEPQITQLQWLIMNIQQLKKQQ